MLQAYGPVRLPGQLGPEAVAEYLEASRAGWKHLTSDPTVERVGPEIVVVHRLHGNLLDGTPREVETADAFRFREGRVGRMRSYAAPEQAFAAAPLRRWVDAYREAWETNDVGAVAALFTLDGVYRIEPWEAWVGREEIVAGWLEHADKPGDTEFHWWHVARDGDLWILEARTRYHSLGKDYRQPLAGRARRRGAGSRLQRVVEAVARRRSRFSRPSLRIRFAALWPEAAITPPPGWVPAPQR